MIQHDGGLSRQAWRRVARMTAVMMAISIVASMLLTKIFIDGFFDGVNVQHLSLAAAMPVLLGSPMVFYLCVKHEQLHNANERLAIIASTDWLTGCLNRFAFHSRAEADLDRPLLGPGALLIIDADGFKSVNDHHGHQAGDNALRQIAAAIRTNVATADLVGRLGGEEFGVFLSDASIEVADQVAERIRGAVAALRFLPDGVPCRLSVSIGGASFSRPAQFEDLYRLADQRLYDAKHDGRDRVAMMQAA